jgi:hypothetical protein
MALTAKQRRFVDEYLVDLNATQAAIRAGYSAKTAYSQAERLLRNVEVAEATAAGKAARSIRTGVAQDDVIAGLLAEARRTGEGATHVGRINAWALLGKHLGMFRERLELSGAMAVEVSDPVADARLAAIVARAAARHSTSMAEAARPLSLGYGALAEARSLSERAGASVTDQARTGRVPL